VSEAVTPKAFGTRRAITSATIVPGEMVSVPVLAAGTVVVPGVTAGSKPKVVPGMALRAAPVVFAPQPPRRC